MGTIVTYVSRPYYHQVQKGEGRVINQPSMSPSHNMRSSKSLWHSKKWGICIPYLVEDPQTRAPRAFNIFKWTLEGSLGFRSKVCKFHMQSMKVSNKATPPLLNFWCCLQAVALLSACSNSSLCTGSFSCLSNFSCANLLSAYMSLLLASDPLMWLHAQYLALRGAIDICTYYKAIVVLIYCSCAQDITKQLDLHVILQILWTPCYSKPE